MGQNANNLYTSSGSPQAGTGGRSAVLRAEFDLIESGFKKVRKVSRQIYFEDANNGSHERAVVWGHVDLEAAISRMTAVNIAANGTADTVFTTKINTATVTHPTWSIAAADSAFSTDSVVPTADNEITNFASVIRVETDGGGSTTMPVMITIELTLE